MKRRPSITLGARALLGAALALACACGNADLIAPEPLAVADTSPSNGALVAAGDTPIVVTFTDDVDEATLDASVTLDETSPAGLPIASVPLTRESYADATYTVVFRAAALEGGRTFRLVVHRDPLRATSGAALRADVVRAFQTAP